MYQHDEMRSDNRMLLILASTKMEHVKTDARSYTLYHNNWSVCSLMARLTLELAGRSNNSFPHVEQIPIDIQHGGQLEEYYLCDVNPKGTVGLSTF